MVGNIVSENNTIKVLGDFGVREMQQMLAAMHNLTTMRGYSDLNIDFSDCKSAFSGQMLGIAANVQNYLINGIDTSLIPPSGNRFRRLFINTNWAHLIDFRRFTESTYRGYSQIPAMKFRDADQLYETVSTIMKNILGALNKFDRSHLTAIEWSVNEITDNVLNHAQSPVGGFVQVTNHSRREQIEFSVCDAGLGIPATLRSHNPKLSTDQEALEKAIQEGVTRDKSVGQGNGLYGTWRISQLSGGRFELYSGNASLISTPQDGLTAIRGESIPFNGSLVTTRIGYGKPLELKDALTFDSKPYVPLDIIDLDYNEDEEGNVTIYLKQESGGFGSRKAGEPVRRKINNLSRIAESGHLIIDFSDIPLMSSSYADEVFGKLFVEVGPIEFSRRFELRNLDDLVEDLINKAIMQRSISGL